MLKNATFIPPKILVQNLSSMKQLVKEEFIRFLFGLTATAMGVFIALWVDNQADKRQEKDAYHAMLRAIRIEAAENQIILEQSFVPHFKTSIVRREFITNVCDNAISTRIFLDHAPVMIITVLTKYTLALQWANDLRRADEKYKYAPEQYAKWEQEIQPRFTTVLDSCAALIPRVLQVSPEK